MKNLIIIGVLFFNVTLMGQELFVSSGISFSEFDYENSQNIQLENLQSKSFTYWNLGTRIPLFERKLQFLGIAAFHQYGAIGSNPGLDNYYNWETNYVGGHVGLDAQLLKVSRFSIHMMGTSGFEFLVRGTQTLNNQVYDLVGAEDFDKPILSFGLGASVEYEVSQTINLAMNYKYGVTSQLGNGSSNTTPEDLKFKSHQFGFSLYFNIENQESKDTTTIETKN